MASKILSEGNFLDTLLARPGHQTVAVISKILAFILHLFDTVVQMGDGVTLMVWSLLLRPLFAVAKLFLLLVIVLVVAVLGQRRYQLHKDLIVNEAALCRHKQMFTIKIKF